MSLSACCVFLLPFHVIILLPLWPAVNSFPGFHPSIHSLPFNPITGLRGEQEPIPADTGRRQGTSRQFIIGLTGRKTTTHTHIHTYGQFRISS